MFVLSRIPHLPLTPAEYKKINSESKSKSGEPKKITVNDQLNAVIKAIEDKHGGPTSRVATQWDVSKDIFYLSIQVV
jgi:hypothetical protein